MDAPIDRYIALPTGLTYHLLEWNHPTSQTTVVLVHGFLDLGWGWRWVADELAKSYHVVAPDMRGHGDSDWVGTGGYYYFYDYVADLDHVIRRVARRSLLVVGHSMGGSVASYWAGARSIGPAGRRPDAIAMLEGLGPPQNDESVATRIGSWIDQWQRVRSQTPRPLASLDEAVTRLRRHDVRLSLEMAQELAAHGTRTQRQGIVWKHDPLHVTAGPIPFRREVAASLWSQIRCPVLLVEARQSTLRLPAAETATRRSYFADAREAIIEDAGHMMQRHQPIQVAQLIGELADRAGVAEKASPPG
jgi:pimeloyl-ACP methyl ester carboxylesterase